MSKTIHPCDVDVCKKGNDALDVLKFVLSLMIIAIHANFFPQITFPWVRCAVPLFFVISSYLFFLHGGKWLRFSVRIMRLYIAWFLLLLPITIYAHRADWFSCGLWQGVANFLWSLLCSSTFLASWFFTALTISVGLVMLFRRYRWVLLVVALILHILGALYCSYPNILKHSELLFACSLNAYRICFLRAIPWVVTGMWLADLETNERCNNKRSGIILLCLGIVLLFVESGFVCANGHGFKNVIYLSLPIIVIPSFLLVKNLSITCKQARQLRKFSIIAYPLHYSVLVCCMGLMRHIGYSDSYGVVLFLIGVLSSAIAYFLIEAAEKKGVGLVAWLH